MKPYTLEWWIRMYTEAQQPYSGCHSGKGIKDGRGFNNLLNQKDKDNG